MDVSSVLGLHGCLHVIMFAVIAILIKRCADMQTLPNPACDTTQDTTWDTTVDTAWLTHEETGQDMTPVTAWDTMKDTGKDMTHDTAWDTIEGTGQVLTQDTEWDTIEDTGQVMIQDTASDTIEDTGQVMTQDTALDTTEMPWFTNDDLEHMIQNTAWDTIKDNGQDTTQDPSWDTTEDTVQLMKPDKAWNILHNFKNLDPSLNNAHNHDNKLNENDVTSQDTILIQSTAQDTGLSTHQEAMLNNVNTMTNEITQDIDQMHAFILNYGISNTKDAAEIDVSDTQDVSDNEEKNQDDTDRNLAKTTINGCDVTQSLGELMHDADNLHDVMQGYRPLQDHNEQTAAYCATDVSNKEGRNQVNPSTSSHQESYTQMRYDSEDDITMLTSEATSIPLESTTASDTYDLFTKASTFIIDSTVGTFMQMTQAYMQDDYPSSHQVEQVNSHVIETEGSSVWCWGSHHTQRICRFHNLCYLPEHDDFVFFHSPNTIIHGVPSDRFSPALLDISSVHDHNGQYFNFVDLPASQAAGLAVEIIATTSLIYRRFNPENLMHVIHDDLLPMFYTLHMISENSTRAESSPFNIQLVFLEGWTAGDHINLYKLFSSYKPMLKSDLQSKTKLTCFSDAYVGVTKATTWYQYGFREPQGPVPGCTVTAHEIRMFTNYMKNRLNTPSAIVPNGQDYIVLFTRKHNRLIVNEVELTFALVTQLQRKVILVSIETHSVAEIVTMLSKAAVLIGMHGSLLSLAMFLQPGAILVELFPYAINPEHYTPYKTLAQLPGMDILYKTWRNADLSQSVGHPDRAWDTGGISHLPPSEQDRILQSSEVPRHLCCRDPEWLYRIYQDTIVDTNALVSLVGKAIEERSQLLKSGLSKNTVHKHGLHPGQVLDIQCEGQTFNIPQSIHNLTPPSIALSWKPPWNVPYLNPQSVKYEVWIQEQGLDQYTAWILSRTAYRFNTGLKPQTNYSVWVRCIIDDHIHGPFNKDHISCST